MPKLIESIYKDKIGIGQSYPLGTAEISNALDGVPQYQELSISYRNSEGASLGASSSGFKRGKVKEDTSDLLGFQQVLSISYSYLRSTWSLVIQRTPSAQKKEVKSFLISTGLPIIKDWLMQERIETWYNGYWYFQVGINKAIDKYAIRENFNHQVITKRIENLMS